MSPQRMGVLSGTMAGLFFTISLMAVCGGLDSMWIILIACTPHIMRRAILLR